MGPGRKISSCTRTAPVLWAIAAAMLAGCAAVGPDYVPPEVTVPPGWKRAAGKLATTGRADTEALAHWWRQLDDTLLSELVTLALEANTDLRAAQARLREARARRALAQANLSPSLTASGSVSRSRGSEETGNARTVELYDAGFDAAWEPDIFGGRRRAIEAAQADLERSAAGLANAQVSLVAEVALNYVELRGFQTRLAIARGNLESQSETLQISRWREQAGLATALDVEQALASAEQTRAQIPALETGLAQAQHRIAVLLGREPGALTERLSAFAPIPSVPANVAVGIPAETLRRRPDVQAAERQVAAESARIGEAVAAAYPSFTLSGSIGLEALTLRALGGTSALAHSLLARVSSVLFDGGRLRSQVQIRGAIHEQALVAYEATILAALQDVENALVALENSRRRQAALQDAATAARNASTLALQRYSSGLVDFQVVLDSQRTVLAIEDNLASSRTDGTTALVRLYKALGGGWTPAGPSEPAQPSEGNPS